jgi:hypothetical protein
MRNFKRLLEEITLHQVYVINQIHLQLQVTKQDQV